MPFFWNSTRYTEYISERGPGASPVISLANDASWATRIFDVAWDAQLQAILDFVGYATVLPTGLSYPNPTAYISRVLPMPFPFYREEQLPYVNSQGVTVNPRPNLYCTKINRIQGLGFTDIISDDLGLALADYNIARMELGFETLPYDIIPDTDQTVIGSSGFPDEALLTRYVTKLPSPSADYISLKIGMLKFAAEPLLGVPVPFAPPKILVSHDLHFRWELVPREAVPSVAINPQLTIGSPQMGNGAAVEYCLGRVNADYFPPNPFQDNTGFAPGTLLLTAASITPIRGANGRRLFTVEYFMKFQPNGFHTLFAPIDGGTGGWVEASTDGKPYPIDQNPPDGKHIYDVADFAWLFRPPLVNLETVIQLVPRLLPP